MVNISVLCLGCLMLIYSCDGSMEDIVGELQRELQQLKMKTTTYENKIKHLENSALSSATEMQSLKSTVVSFLNEILTLKEQLKMNTASYENKIQHLENTALSSVREMQSLKSTVVSLSNEILTLKQQVKYLKEERSSTEKLKRRFNTNLLAVKPAFSASLSNHATGLGISQTIIFDRVLTNDLNAYSGVTGIFTAPMSGTYFFTATVMSPWDDHVQTDMCLNGHAVAYIYLNDTSHDQGTNIVVLVLNAGDKFWVRHRFSTGLSVHGNNWSSFSGFML